MVKYWSAASLSSSPSLNSDGTLGGVEEAIAYKLGFSLNSIYREMYAHVSHTWMFNLVLIMVVLRLSFP